ncbi:hypothetical protein RchiOBHm_Chr4g0414851 [Rosa chinensis]|uniref:Uncharacterized protein n=1 Tax=Rosa chinensis TaxID=74649 RepID=A0A2P6QWE6_ROSCH|nr:hypothetical protein RchiOBHm_Chr4g0414851 [Rosa chinensis]
MPSSSSWGMGSGMSISSCTTSMIIIACPLMQLWPGLKISSQKKNIDFWLSFLGIQLGLIFYSPCCFQPLVAD